ncbi:hypothetical protein [Anaerovibrio lipolyticus]|uniref:hypothetical protein n=1 Tax=Anaerovibrio lipolyticus TaxID=82374 RepID=UPI00055C810A|nr:hypothetical protein [Anaerovibrio lipolyticus]
MTDKQKEIKKYVLLYIDLIIYSLVAVMAKFAAMRENILMISLFMGIEVILLVVHAIIWQKVLKHFDLVIAMSNKGVTVILGLIWSALIFGEIITIWNVVGAVIIVFGIWIVTSDE